MTETMKCKFGDPTCPCQDGDMCHYKGDGAWPAPARSMHSPIPLRCLCGNAILSQRLPHEFGLREVIANLCPACDTGGGFEETWYVDDNGEMRSFPDIAGPKP